MQHDVRETQKRAPLSFFTRGRGERRRSPPDQFDQEVAIIKAQITQLNGRWIIHPRDSKWTQQWDAVSFLCILFTAIVTPFEIGVMPPQQVSTLDFAGLVLFVINRVVDVFFMADLALNFFLAYQEDHGKGGQWVTDRRKIVRHYLQSWFVIDVFSVLPFDLLMSFGLLAGEGANLLRITRTMRLLRLMKLLRILRASRVLTRWQSLIGLSYAHLTMIRFMLSTCFLVHLMACTWAWTGINGPDVLPNRCMGTFEECWGSHPMTETSWIVNHHLTLEENPSNHQRLVYIVSFTQAVCAMFGSIGPIAPGTIVEYIIVTLMMLFGSMVWAWVIGSLCGILATLNPHATAFRNQMDELNYFIHMTNMPSGMRERLREYFRMTQDYERQHAYDGLLHKMSIQLRGDTALQIGTKQLAAVWYFRINPHDGSVGGIEKEFLSVVALNLTAAAYEKREIVPTHDLTIMDRGMATLRLVVLSKGETFGQDCVMQERFHHWRSDKAAFTLTFVQTSSISCSSLSTLVAHFPRAQRRLRSAAARYTIAAAFRNAFAGWRHHRNDRSASYTAAHAAFAHYSRTGSSGESFNTHAQSFAKPPSKQHSKHGLSQQTSNSGHPRAPSEGLKLTRQAKATLLGVAHGGWSRFKHAVHVKYGGGTNQGVPRKGKEHMMRYLGHALPYSPVQCLVTDAVRANSQQSDDVRATAGDDVYSMQFGHAFTSVLKERDDYMGTLRRVTRRMKHMPVLGDTLTSIGTPQQPNNNFDRKPAHQPYEPGFVSSAGGGDPRVVSVSSAHTAMAGGPESTCALEAVLHRFQEQIQSHVAQQIEAMAADVKADLAALSAGFGLGDRAEHSRATYSKGSPATDGLDDILDERQQRPRRRRANKAAAPMQASTATTTTPPPPPPPPSLLDPADQARTNVAQSAVLTVSSQGTILAEGTTLEA